MKVVNSWNDFDPLKHCIVGRADNCCIAPSEPASKVKVPLDSPMRGMTGPRPLDTVEKANAQLDNLVKVLEGRGVKVDRPDALQWNQAVVTPHFMTGSMFGCMPPRDVLLTIGRDIICTSMSFRSRFFEHYAYSRVLRKYFEQDPEFRWIYSPRPELGDASFDLHYFDGDVTEETLLERTAKKYFVSTEHEILFDAADVLRLGKDLFVQHGSTTNLKAMEWLRRMYPDMRVHAVNFPGDPYPIHIDATFVPLRPGLIINNPERPLPKEQRKIFEANDWEIVEAAKSAHTEPPPLCYSSVWLSMNLLVLDHKTVIVEESEVYQQEQLDKLGFEVIPVPFRDAYPFGGGLHCATADVYREGTCQDYFPNQVDDPTLITYENRAW
ncbi:MAG: serine/threonine protein kinase [Bacillota bacterium]|jgi:glycine amidinotransferase|nr:serine/threonine protein kinase [Bacillota bacterium]NLL59837.1 serine/threonine protein kinase [Tissierellia bacterium]